MTETVCFAGIAWLVWALAMLASEPVKAAEPDAAIGIIRAVNPQLDVEELQAAQWRVILPDNAATGRELLIARILQAGADYFVAEQGTSRWHLGRRRYESFERKGTVVIAHTFNDLSALTAAAEFSPLPKVPSGFEVREVVRFPSRPIEMVPTLDDKGVYVLFEFGDVWHIELSSGRRTLIIQGSEYINPQRGTVIMGGMAMGPKGDLWLVVNQQIFRALPVSNDVTIFRTSRLSGGIPTTPLPWLRTNYPWGLEPYAHGVGRIRFGPDARIYLASGSRTNTGEIGTDGRFWRGGEHALTSCLWRIDPAAIEPKIEVYASGLRLCGGFDWDSQDRLLATDCQLPPSEEGELNLIEARRTYGFPPAAEETSLVQNPAVVTPPLANLGPADGATPANALWTFAARSRPWAVQYAGTRLGEQLSGLFLVSRLGPKTGEGPGFDILSVRLVAASPNTVHPSLGEAADEAVEAAVFMSGVARPIDLKIGSNQQLYVLEQTRATVADSPADLFPGRLLEVRQSR